MERNQEEQIILNRLSADGAAYRAQGVAMCIKTRLNTPNIVKSLDELKNDHIEMLGRPMFYYAIAALDIIGAERYKGTNADIIDLIHGLPITFS